MVREEDWFPKMGHGSELYNHYYSAYWDEWAKLFGYENLDQHPLGDGNLRGQFCQFMGVFEGFKIAEDSHAGDIDNVVELAHAKPEQFQKFRALVRLGATPNGGK